MRYTNPLTHSFTHSPLITTWNRASWSFYVSDFVCVVAYYAFAANPMGCQRHCFRPVCPSVHALPACLCTCIHNVLACVPSVCILSPACRRHLVTLPPVGERSIVMSMSSVFVCLSLRDHIFGTTCPIFTKFFVHVTYDPGSVLLWWRSDTLHISGFVDDVISALKLRLLDSAGWATVAARLTRSLGLSA